MHAGRRHLSSGTKYIIVISIFQHFLIQGMSFKHTPCLCLDKRVANGSLSGGATDGRFRMRPLCRRTSILWTDCGTHQAWLIHTKYFRAFIMRMVQSSKVLLLLPSFRCTMIVPSSVHPAFCRPVAALVARYSSNFMLWFLDGNWWITNYYHVLGRAGSKDHGWVTRKHEKRWDDIQSQQDGRNIHLFNLFPGDIST